MKHLIFAVIMALCTLTIGCKKETITNQQPHQESAYRVLVIGADTSTSTSMFARAQAVGIVVSEDAKLKAELMGYNGQGVYTIRVTNKQNCQAIVRWGWDGLTIDNITPTSDVLPPNGVVEFTLTGDHKVGRVKLKAESDCGNSSTLIINVTAAVLPITFIENTASRDPKTGKVTIKFTVDDPAQIDWILIQKYTDGVWKQVLLIGADHLTKSYTIPL